MEESFITMVTTIQKKTSLTLKKAGGVTIWELTKDVKEEKSLLNVIDKTSSEKGKTKK